MIKRDELVAYLAALLGCDNFTDYAPNGLQVEGKEAIRHLCTAVTASAKAIEEAAFKKADALLVHHGFFWRGEAPVLTGMKRVRIGRLMAHDMNLLAYHLPLDCHPQFGNNAELGKRLNIKNMSRHIVGNTADLLWAGELAENKSAAGFAEHIQTALGRTPLLLEGSDRLIKRVAWCSGGAQDFIVDAHQLGVDAYLSGEVSERTYYQAMELGIHYFACGHHATERFGIQALAEHLVERFDVTHHFIDSANPV
ncbi:Nif3-like dinuclear metal center hexameric protein [Legionella spiritensis]|uniref:GTP cyclohydrolase 1 type 2 homolog n=1 Tax=Legionella spiritensis TaxID=452 RepID=A0A0W0ZAL9_LEGSP|nr:putative NIF3-like protein 1 [Legionella spiritensis]SNV35156.1 putative NIF3-like protein 1 [Legionella spiritensis]